MGQAYRYHGHCIHNALHLHYPSECAEIQAINVIITAMCLVSKYLNQTPESAQNQELL